MARSPRPRGERWCRAASSVSGTPSERGPSKRPRRGTDWRSATTTSTSASLAQTLTDREPFREQRWVLPAEACYRSGRQADALLAVNRAPRLLREELGIDPGPALVRIQRAVLEQDPALELGIDWIQAAGQLAGRNLTAAEWEQYIGELSSFDGTCPAFA